MDNHSVDFSNITQPEPIFTKQLTLIMMVLQSTLTIFGIPTNVIVCLCLILQWNRMKLNDLLMLNLSLADGLYCAVR